MSSIPSEYIGLWRRKGILRSDGSSDHSTQVWWFQSSRFHIDLRIPADRPLLADPGALDTLAPPQLASFAAQTGFAGLTVVDGQRCEWRPEIAFPALCAELDAGTMRFESADHLHEAGIDGSYQEDWLRVARGPVLGLRLEATCPAAPSIAYLLIGASWLAWAQGAPDDCFSSATAAGRAPAWSEFLIAREDTPHSGDWRIAACNNVWREGDFLRADSLTRRAQYQVGELIAFAGSGQHEWRVTDVAPSH